MVSTNGPRCGTSDCKNWIQMTVVKYVQKNHWMVSILTNTSSSSATTQTVDTNQTSDIEEVNPLITKVSTIPHNQSNSNYFVDDSDNYSDDGIDEDPKQISCLHISD